jgi:glycosyltransferase involved in cell wall biosynthesis
MFMTKQLHSVHVVPSISEEASGPSYSVPRLCESLVDDGGRVTLAVLDRNIMPFPPAFLKTFQGGYGPKRLGRSPAMHKWLKETAARHEMDIIHNHSLWMMPNVYPGWAARRFNIPFVVSPRGTLSRWAMNSGSVVKRGFWPLVQRPALEAVTCFHATAESEYRDVREAGFRQPVAIVPNGIDLPTWQPRISPSPRTLLFLGRIHPVKGLDTLLRAWQVVMSKFPEWQLRIAGPDNAGYLGQMRRLAAELRLERLEFAGALYGTDKWQAYQQADLFVLPTHSENFGMSVAESLAAGTPAIVTKGGPWEALNNHRAGWWIESGMESLVATLESTLSVSFEELQAMGLRGREWMEREFSWRRTGQMMAETYRWILQGGQMPDWIYVD